MPTVLRLTRVVPSPGTAVRISHRFLCVISASSEVLQFLLESLSQEARRPGRSISIPSFLGALGMEIRGVLIIAVFIVF